MKLLREARVGRDITQAQVAAQMDCTESQVSRWESCRLRMDMRDLDEYLRVIDVDMVGFINEWKRLAEDLEGSDVEVKLLGQKRARPEPR